MFDPMILRRLVAVPLLVLSGIGAPLGAEAPVLDPIEGIVATDLEDGSTAYECAGVTRTEAKIALSPMLIQTESGTHRPYIGLYLGEVNDGEMGPLVLSIDGEETRLAIPADFMKMEISGGRPSVTTTIDTKRDLMKAIASARVVDVAYKARDIDLKATLTPADRERFQRIVDLQGRGSLPPAVLIGGEKAERPPLLTGTPEKGVSPPVLIRNTRVVPHYPAAARTSHRSGRVVLAILVLKDGTVGRLRPLSVAPTGTGFTKSALDAVRRWRYKPALKDGQPVDSDFTVVVDFRG
jgi:TonB family protein